MAEELKKLSYPCPNTASVHTGGGNGPQGSSVAPPPEELLDIIKTFPDVLGHQKWYIHTGSCLPESSCPCVGRHSRE